MPNILLIDIETSPILGYTWELFDANVLSVVEPIKILCCGWKWLHEDRIYVRGICDYPDYNTDALSDKSLISDIWSLLDKADVVVAHNGDAFDVKIINARFLVHGLNPPSDYKTVDTLKAAKKYFKFSSNSLNNLGEYLQEGKKSHTGGFSLWLGCMNGDKQAWERMKAYNEGDIQLLERIYLRLRPYIGNHPNLNAMSPILSSRFACTVCQSTNTQKRGKSVTRMGAYQRYQCLDCGSWSSGEYERLKRQVSYAYVEDAEDGFND